MAMLVSTDPTMPQKRFPLEDGPLIIGRSPSSDIVVDDPSVSRRHAQVEQQNGQFYIRDLSSRNGTLVNGTEINKPTRLFDGSRIQICETEFAFFLDGEHINMVRQPATESSRLLATASSILLVDEPHSVTNSVSSIRSSLDVSSHHPGSVVGADAKLNAIFAVSRALREAHDRDGVLQAVMNTLFELFADADRGFVAFREPDGQIVATLMKTRRSQFEEQIRISRTIANLVLDSRQAILSSDAAADSRFDMSQSLADFRIRSMMCAPLIDADDRAVGVIQLDTFRSALAFQPNDLEVLAAVATQASLALQRLEMSKRFQAAQRLEQEMALAHQVQLRFLPQQAPQMRGYEFYSHYRANAQVGGDYFDYLKLDQDRVAIAVADVVGHGVAAALLMAKISAEVRYAVATHADPAAAVELINRNLSDLSLDQFVTLVLGVINSRTHELTIVNAGHTLPLVKRGAQGIEILSADFSGMPLGVNEQATYPSRTIALQPRDWVLFYTDGVTEAMNAKGQMLGVERLIEELNSAQVKTSEAIGKVICQAIRHHCGQERPQDDVCLVSVARVE